MATPENIAMRRSQSLTAIMDSLKIKAADLKVELRPLPALNRQPDHNHRELALIEWIRDGLVATGFIPKPAAPLSVVPPVPDSTNQPEGNPDGDKPPQVDLQRLTKDKLLALATDRKVASVTAANTKAEIIAALTPPVPDSTNP